MYRPKAFDMADPTVMADFIRRHSFGVLISTIAGTPTATHVPFLYDQDQHALYAHMAKANPQWQTLEGQTALVIFSGPHAYVSPTWYEVPESVPTWNYAAVHVYGTAHVIQDDQQLADLLDRTVRFYEADSPLIARTHEPFYRRLMQAVVGFRIDVTQMEGAAKLSQNKPIDVQQRVMDHLRASSDPGAQAVAELMKEIVDARRKGHEIT
ncbi:MAG: FMN-binding negative transcriptional regulator [Alicyclobacillus sp.]|nr:FMN-binding negative transcriptional regulator [Alicyclobacillus sp.]